MMHCGVVIADKKDQQGPSEQELEELWDTVSSDLSSIFQGRGPALPTDVTPFDAASDVDIDQQMYVHVGVHNVPAFIISASKQVLVHNSAGWHFFPMMQHNHIAWKLQCVYGSKSLSYELGEDGAVTANRSNVTS